MTKLSEDTVYNPLDKTNLQETVARALDDRPAFQFSSIPSIHGSGVYALYYAGPFSLYQPLVLAGGPSRLPIYVGKAEPSGKRTGTTSPAKQKRLQGRLRKHSASIDAVRNLKLPDFSVKYLVIEEAWIHFCEIALIQKFQPIWNTALDGFGNNPQGAGRKDSIRSLWDSVHPGRKNAANLKDNPGVAAAVAEVRERLAKLTAR